MSLLLHRVLRAVGRDIVRIGRGGEWLIYEPRDGSTAPQQVLEVSLYWENLRTLIHDRRIDLVVDVGANVGDFAKGLRDIGYRGRIASCEPNPELAVRLRHTAKGDPNWSIHETALGNAASSATLHIPTNAALGSLLEPSSYGLSQFEKSIYAVDEVTVKVERLEDFLRSELHEYQRVFLKIDTQGYDLEVFNGLGVAYRKVELLQSEMSLNAIYEKSPSFTESLARFARAGFRPFGFYPVCRDRRGGMLNEVDCVMIRIDHSADTDLINK